jgi:hypothetical protein
MTLEQAREASHERLCDAWVELRGYVAEAEADGKPLTAAELLAYMDELRRNAREPIKQWMEGLRRA